ncbi:hypothetical protein LF1_41560 [Rubripirellula obstinata]|uniref:Uncharacterized protein n=1 Tax=Rubripirellula obstinata TaxID=406547 RepID=A0A5B1CNS6_9BACT|nr:hypothetical protein [Rubripirellula obstinata]KAA1261605.1 hypothetical protein LF1_41560 [Rubripirellula obstinata]
MANQLYILGSDDQPVPVTWAQYDDWEESLSKDARCALGKRLKTNVANGIAITTVFLMTPIGYFGRKPQLWLTMTVGDGVFEERRYSSHRAAMQGHSASCREFRQHVPKIARIDRQATAVPKLHDASESTVAAG